MIISFRNRRLEAFWNTGSTRGLPVQNTARVRIILDALNVATRPLDLNVPGMFWHNLGPRWPHRWSVRVTGNYRVTFAWAGADAIEVDIEDYH